MGTTVSAGDVEAFLGANALKVHDLLFAPPHATKSRIQNAVQLHRIRVKLIFARETRQKCQEFELSLCGVDLFLYGETPLAAKRCIFRI